MGLSRCFWLCLGILLFPTLSAAASSSSSSMFISDGVFESQAYTGRSLLQAKKPCPVNFEFQNYTVITSKCKGPYYPADLCCSAFKEFACPYVQEINDASNVCAATMFSYINLNGKYPPGLFANECREGKEGLACPAQSPSLSANENGSSITGYSSSLLILVTVIFMLFHRW